MKLKSIILFINLFAIASLAFPQTEMSIQKLPSVDLRTPDGKIFNTSSIHNDGKPIIISFWATWCTNCIKELNVISEEYENWQKETGVKLIAISIDDVRNAAKVMPFANGKNWDYEILLDQNKDLYRALGITVVPTTFLLDGNGNIV
ncbi:MAG: TlpA family protein disulfide reductase [Lentimicrobiaceae bacterium]|nr:TlpA family protein disulfide reductase [Lentimicrobiaceae bacterium]